MAKIKRLTSEETFTAEQPNFSKVGDVVQSMLDEVDFQTVRDGTWVLMDGRDVTGSDFETLTGSNTLPDARGQFLRSKNNGRADGEENPDGEIPLGGLQDQATAKNGLNASSSTGSNYQLEYSSAYKLTGIATNGHSGLYATGVGNSVYLDRNFAYSTSTSLSGDNETRPKNVTINIFIKINS